MIFGYYAQDIAHRIPALINLFNKSKKAKKKTRIELPYTLKKALNLGTPMHEWLKLL